MFSSLIGYTIFQLFNSTFQPFINLVLLYVATQFLEQEINIQSHIVQKAKEGQQDAQQWLYQQFSKAMFNICTRMVGNRIDAEDVLQEIFIIAFKNLHQLKDEKQFGGWLKRITINECIRYGKKQFFYEGWEDERFEDLKDEDESHWWHNVNLKTIHQAIKQLPEGCRQVFNLFAIEDYSHRDIALNLGISESTSKSQYYRAKQLLKQSLLNTNHYG